MKSGSPADGRSESAPNDPGRREDGSLPQDIGSGDPSAAGGDPSAKQKLAADWRRFSERLATFGLGEAQTPLLTDAVWSFDAEGNPR
jgi:hypothetical protein